jgi:hypothetical protein
MAGIFRRARSDCMNPAETESISFRRPVFPFQPFRFQRFSFFPSSFIRLAVDFAAAN